MNLEMRGFAIDSFNFPNFILMFRETSKVHYNFVIPRPSVNKLLNSVCVIFLCLLKRKRKSGLDLAFN